MGVYRVSLIPENRDREAGRKPAPSRSTLLILKLAKQALKFELAFCKFATLHLENVLNDPSFRFAGRDSWPAQTLPPMQARAR